MTTTLFIQILNMSLGAAWAALFVIAARFFLRRFSHCYCYALWGVVLFRLVCPVSFSSVLSLMPRPQAIPQDIAYAVQPGIESGFAVIDQAVNQTLASAPLPAVATPAAAAVNPIQAWLGAGMLVWQAGTALLLLYGLASFLHFLGKLQGAVLVQDNIWESDRVPTAFVLGVFRPRIYLPTGLKEQEKRYVLCHEQTHIRRMDHIIKPVSLLLLTVHWFNPVLWLAWFLMRRDMEMSCDELALRKLGLEVRKDYSACLLNLSARQSGLAAPLAFGENDVKGRIVNILRYKKPALFGTVLSVVLAGALGFCLLSNPGENNRTVIPDPDPNEDSGITLANLDGDGSGAVQGEPAPEPEKGIDLAIYQSPDEPAASLIHYTAPVRGSNMQVVKDPNRLEYHVDYGTPVYSPIRGTVEEFTDYPYWPYGKYVVVRSSENPDIVLWMIHLSSVAEGLKEGDQVDSTTQIGAAGTTGNASFPTATVVVGMKTDGGENLAIPKEQWDAIFDNWRDGISGEPDPDPYTFLGPINAARLGTETWASPKELKNLVYLYEDLSAISAPSNGDRLPVAQMLETLSYYFENVTAQDIIASGDYDYDPATDTILYNWEGARVIEPVLLNLTSWERKSGEEELFIIDYRLLHSGENPDTAASRRLTVKLLADGSFRYLSNLEPGDPRNP